MAKKRRRLTDEEANLLGFELKKHSKDRVTATYSLDSNQWLQITKVKHKGIIESVVKNSSITKPNDYKEEKFFLSAYCKETKTILGIEDFCKKYNQPFENVSSYKFLPYHYKEPSYNIVFKEQLNEDEFNIEDIRIILNSEIKQSYTYKRKKSKRNIEGVIKWSDLHFGAHIRNLIKTPDYDSDVLLDGLLESVEDVNQLGFSKAHVHINGDLIESFTGLSHINSWMSLDKNKIGSNSIMLCCELLEKALVKIDNLGSIKIVAGNHDRLTSNNKEDVKGGAAELIAWGLKLKGFEVEFNSMVITHKVNGINHINLHGHLGISKRSSSDIILNYGIQGVYNLICEGHLHSIIETLSAKQRDNFKIVSDDSIDHRRMYLQSFFTGNYYSESLGYTTNAGYSIFWDNGKGKPKHLNATR
ncbi:hypothetical protein [Polaribacter sp. IC073]|uniref:hypothetical protein n=1 Tax=Polaribacter sp. IC073 TaxID=2508540 RepID=UPI0011BE2614|nr:hypothetical protein [Polaribacter sp. IC073]TXD47322.1 hypothetical protein ES045_12045 [Polaribacter sp. IC073]